MSETRSQVANPKYQRKLSNKLINPKEQLTMGARLVSVGLGAAILGFYIAYRGVLNDLEALLRMGYLQQDGFTAIRSSILWSLGYIAVDILVIFVSIVVFGVWISHRIYGPIIPLRRHVRALIDGNYTGSVRLRKEDAFQELAKDLNELTRTLAEKSK